MNNHNSVTRMQDYRQEPQILRELPMLSPPENLWADIETKAKSNTAKKRWLKHTAQAFEFALAASLLLMVVVHVPQQITQNSEVEQQLEKIQSYSALLDKSWQYQEADKQVSSAQKALATSTLQDQLTVVDSQLNTQPKNRGLWLKRTNLMEQLLGFYEPQEARLMVLK